MPELPSYPLRPMTLNVGTVLQNGKYVIQSPMLAGGFSVAYRATHTGTSQSVLLKTLHPSLRERRDFQQLQQQCIAQIRRLAQCHHPHLVRVSDYFVDGDRGFWVIDDHPGVTLASLVESHGPLPETLAVHYITQVGRALMEMHSNGLLHGNIQPLHIRRLAGAEAAVLTDLGLVGDLLSGLSATYPDRLAPGYAAPEQYQTPVRCTPATDVYGLAATLYYLLTGQTPVAASLRGQAPLPAPGQFQPGLTPAVEQSILAGMAIAPAQRPASLAEWLKQLPQHKSVTLPQGLKRSNSKSAQPKASRPQRPASPQAPVAGTPSTAAQPGTTVAATSPTHSRSAQAQPTEVVARSAKSAPASIGKTPKASHPSSPRSPKAAVKPKASSRRWLPVALVITSLTAAGAGAGLGFAFRLQQPNAAGVVNSRSNQTFPPSNNWPGSTNIDSELFFEEPVVLEDELRYYQEPVEDYGTEVPIERISEPEPQPVAEPKAAPKLDPYYTNPAEGAVEPYLDAPIEPEWSPEPETSWAEPKPAADPLAPIPAAPAEPLPSGVDSLPAPEGTDFSKPSIEKDVPASPQSQTEPASPSAADPFTPGAEADRFGAGSHSGSPSS